MTKYIFISNNCVDVFQLLASLETHKAPGPDKIPPRLLQIASQKIANPNFNSSLHQGEPLDWIGSMPCNIVPIFKKGDKSLASNYVAIDQYH